MCLKIIFGISAFLLAALFIMRELGFTERYDSMKASKYVSLMAGVMLVYIIAATLIAMIFENTFTKVIMLLFALSPFIIGKLVTYQKVKIYSIIQIVCVILSFGYLFFI